MNAGSAAPDGTLDRDVSVGHQIAVACATRGSIDVDLLLRGEPI
ncbi:MAG TPA: hypothetical protein VMK13_01440 [Streptosporangiaceae bacterium]|nr:hypothetical protein [Streptosporangiaceae bacterium]